MPNRDSVPGLPALLKAARERCGLSQIQAAQRSGVHAVSIARFETDARTPSIATLIKLARAYGVKPADLIPADETPEKKPKKGK